MDKLSLALGTMLVLCAAYSQAQYVNDFDATLTLIEATGPTDQSPDPTSGLFCRRASDVIGSTETVPLRVEVTGDVFTLSFFEQGVAEQWFQVTSTNIGTNAAANIQRRYFTYSDVIVESPVDGYTSQLVETVKGPYRSDFFPALQATLTEHSTTILNATGELVQCTEKFTLRGGGDAVDTEPDDSGWINDAANTIRNWLIDENQSQNNRRLIKTASIGVRG